MLSEIRDARLEPNLSQAALAKRAGWPQSRYSRVERGVQLPTLEDLFVVASLLGLRVRLDLFRIDEGIRDQGSQALIARFGSVLAPAWHAAREVPFPTLGDLRSWDLMIRLRTSYRVGVEAETRLRDVQELARRIRQRELHGGVDAILMIMSDSAHNRHHVDELLAVLGPDFGTPATDLLAALKAGEPLPGSGVLLI